MRFALAIALTLAASPALATQYDCSGIFSKDTNLAALEAEFGKDNIVTGEVPGPEGELYIATTIYPGDPQRQMQVRWWDEDKLEYFAGVTLAAGDSGPGGVHAGMPIEEVEAINGAPFELWGFFWDYGGGAYFETGKLSGLAGGCSLNVQFSPTIQELPETISNAISGEVTLRSDMAEVRAAKVAVDKVDIVYPYPEALQEGGTGSGSLVDLPVSDVAALIDATSFASSIGPRRQEGLKTFSDYGFTEMNLVGDVVELYEADKSWVFTLRSSRRAMSGWWCAWSTRR